MNWHEFALSIPEMPSSEARARVEYARLLRTVERDVNEPERDEALAALGDTWGEAARFRGWTLTA